MNRYLLRISLKLKWFRHFLSQLVLSSTKDAAGLIHMDADCRWLCGIRHMNNSLDRCSRAYSLSCIWPRLSLSSIHSLPHCRIINNILGQCWQIVFTYKFSLRAMADGPIRPPRDTQRNVKMNETNSVIMSIIIYTERRRQRCCGKKNNKMKFTSSFIISLGPMELGLWLYRVHWTERNVLIKTLTFAKASAFDERREQWRTGEKTNA